MTEETVTRELVKTEPWPNGQIRHTWSGGGSATHWIRSIPSCSACDQEKARREREAELAEAEA